MRIVAWVAISIFRDHPDDLQESFGSREAQWGRC